jgi:hypothetical protein
LRHKRKQSRAVSETNVRSAAPADAPLHQRPRKRTGFSAPELPNQQTGIKDFPFQ